MIPLNRTVATPLEADTNDHPVNSKSPISSLPNEILGLIFRRGQLGRPTHSDTRLTFEGNISHVSQRWRNVAINLPHLWTSIHIFAEISLARISTYLERSKSCPLDLKINLWDAAGEDSEAREAMVISILGVITPHIGRWHSFLLECYYEESVYMVLSRLDNVSAPLLKNMIVEFEEGMESLEGTGYPLHIFMGAAPRLSCVRLDMLRCCWPPLTSLTTFNLRNVHFSEVVYNRFLEALTASPSLTRLSVHGGFIYQESWRLYRHSKIHLPNLRSLRLICPSHLTSGLLMAISAPQLQSLHLQEIHDRDVHTFFESPQPSLKFPTLQILIFNIVDFNETTYRNFALFFPTISHITTISAENLDELYTTIGDTLPHQSSIPAWPDLRILAVRSVDTSQGGRCHWISNAMCKMVSARIGMGRRIQRLLLGVEVLQNSPKNRVDWLRERVQVEEWQQNDDDRSDDEVRCS